MPIIVTTDVKELTIDELFIYQKIDINKAAVEKELRRRFELFKRYKKELEGLTPGGSEFVDEPERCATLIRSSRETQHDLLIKWKKDQNIKNEKIRLAAQKVKDYLSNNHASIYTTIDIILKEVK